MPEFITNLSQAIPPWAYMLLTGLAVAGGQKIRDFISELIKYVWAEDKLSSSLCGALIWRVGGTAKLSPWHTRDYVVSRHHVAGHSREIQVGWQYIIKGATIWVPWKKIWVPVTFRHHEGDFTVRYLRGTFDMPEFVKWAVTDYNEREKENQRPRFKVNMVSNSGSILDADTSKKVGENSAPDTMWGYTSIPITTTFDKIGRRVARGGSNNLSLSKEAQALMQDVRSWHASRNWYSERGLTWKRGYLLYGPPGSGKTSFIRAVAVDLDLPVYVIDLNSLSTPTLLSAWNKVLDDSPCVVVFEDVDAAYHGRKPVQANPLTSQPPSFDALLNCLDGVKETDGVLVYLTTNDLARIDTALGGLLRQDGTLEERPRLRPGRIDKVLEFKGDLSEEGRRQMANRILQGTPDLIEQAVREGVADTPARFQERCVRMALAAKEGLEPDLTDLDPRPPLKLVQEAGVA